MRHQIQIVIVALLLATPVFAQTEGPRLAAYDALDLPQTGQQVTFSKQPAAIGDRVDQTISVSLDLNSTVRRGQEVIDTSANSIGKRQQRTLIAEEMRDGRTVAARVRFAKCSRTADGETVEPPIVGKTYLCRRMEDDTLSITRGDGSFCSPDEFALVSESMDALGKTNPLADYLAGQTAQVGDVLEVPLEVGDTLLGADGALGRVSKFNITLRQVDPQTGVAKFDVEMESQGAETTQMRLMIHGELDVETETCRTRRLVFSGPMGMATTIGSYSAAETTFVRGKLKMEMTANYQDGR